MWPRLDLVAKDALSAIARQQVEPFLREDPVHLPARQVDPHQQPYAVAERASSCPMRETAEPEIVTARFFGNVERHQLAGLARSAGIDACLVFPLPTLRSAPLVALTQGYVQGRCVTIEYRWAGDRYQELRAIADDLVRLQMARC
jgi:hypothetical protein